MWKGRENMENIQNMWKCEGIREKVREEINEWKDKLGENKDIEEEIEKIIKGKN